MKTDGRLDRNFLLGQAGDATNALLAAAGSNLRLVLSAVALRLTSLMAQNRQRHGEIGYFLKPPAAQIVNG
jgi:hypothetical protein